MDAQQQTHLVELLFQTGAPGGLIVGLGWFIRSWFGKLDERLEKMDERIEGVEGRVTKLEKRKPKKVARKGKAA